MIISDIPAVDQIDVTKIKSGDTVTVADGIVTVT